MSNPAYYNFHYNAYAQGAAAALWRYNDGKAAVPTGTYLGFTGTGGVMYYDCGRGQFSFTVNIDNAPISTDSRQWGLTGGLGKLWFDISGTTLTAQASWENGKYTASVPLVWDSSWTEVDTLFSIYWKAGQAVFYVNDIAYAVINDQAVPGGSMSPFINNPAGDDLLIKDISGTGLQSLWQTPASVAGDFGSGGGAVISDRLTSTESVTVKATNLGAVSVSDAITSTNVITGVTIA